MAIGGDRGHDADGAASSVVDKAAGVAASAGGLGAVAVDRGDGAVGVAGADDGDCAGGTGRGSVVADSLAAAGGGDALERV